MQAKWPKLRADNYSHTSDATGRYNCIAFANNRDNKWWQAGLYGGRYEWPSGISDTTDGWVEMFTRQGYRPTDNRKVEAGIEKVAIYVGLDDLLPSHVAKSDGRAWKSKLGRYQDIEHSSLDLLEGDQHCEYGVVERVLERPVRTSRRRK
jgi:hypothetical protein